MNSETKRKVCFVITSKIHYSRNKRVLEALKYHRSIQLQIVLGGAALLERVGQVAPEMEADGFTIDAKCHMTLEESSPHGMAMSAGVGLLEISSVFDRLAPDIVVVRGDRYEMLPVAIAAAYMNIPIAHIEGGDVTGSIDESVRHAITKLSHIHFATNDESAGRIIQMGERSEYVFNFGSPELEVVSENQFEISAELVNDLGVGDIMELDKQFIIAMQHPVTTESDTSQHQINETLHALNDLQIPVVWFWPNVDAGSDGISKGIRLFREHNQPRHMRFLRYLPSNKFYGLLKQAACLVGNSSSGFKESALLGTPVVNIGSRQNNRYGSESGDHIVNVEYDRAQIAEAVRSQLTHGRYTPNTFLFRSETAKNIADTLANISLYTQKTFVDRKKS